MITKAEAFVPYLANIVYQRIRRILMKIAQEMEQLLSRLAEHTGCAVLLIGHMNKASSVKTACRGIGSIDFFAVARSVLRVVRVAEQENIRVMAQIKNNLAEEGQPAAFERRKDEFRCLGAYDITIKKELRGRPAIWPCRQFGFDAWRNCSSKSDSQSLLRAA